MRRRTAPPRAAPLRSATLEALLRGAVTAPDLGVALNAQTTYMRTLLRELVAEGSAAESGERPRDGLRPATKLYRATEKTAQALADLAVHGKGRARRVDIERDPRAVAKPRRRRSSSSGSGVIAGPLRIRGYVYPRARR